MTNHYIPERCAELNVTTVDSVQHKEESVCVGVAYTRGGGGDLENSGKELHYV